MDHSTEVFVGSDVAKARNAIAIADGEGGGEIRYVGEADASAESTSRVVKRITAKHPRAHFCYEAGPTGYGLYRLITALGHSCTVAAPSLIPRKPGARVKTNRRDALALAKLLRAGELTLVWVPDEGHEAMRDLVRARGAAVEDLRAHRQQVSSFMLKHSRIFPGKKTWGTRYLRPAAWSCTSRIVPWPGSMKSWPIRAGPPARPAAPRMLPKKPCSRTAVVCSASLGGAVRHHIVASAPAG